MHILAGDCIVFSRGNLKSERRRSEKAVAPFSFSLSLSLFHVLAFPDDFPQLGPQAGVRISDG